MADATCKTCPFWHGTGSSSSAVCSRNAPMVPGMGRPSHASWPWTLPTDWCGEHPLRQRDRLAAMAMQGLLAAERPGSAEGYPGFADVAGDAYRMADAMIAEREKPTPAQEPTP